MSELLVEEVMNNVVTQCAGIAFLSQITLDEFNVTFTKYDRSNKSSSNTEAHCRVRAISSSEGMLSIISSMHSSHYALFSPSGSSRTLF